MHPPQLPAPEHNERPRFRRLPNHRAVLGDSGKIMTAKWTSSPLLRVKGIKHCLKACASLMTPNDRLRIQGQITMHPLLDRDWMNGSYRPYASSQTCGPFSLTCSLRGGDVKFTPNENHFAQYTGYILMGCQGVSRLAPH